MDNKLITEAELFRLKLLCEKATPPPWDYHCRNMGIEKDELDSSDYCLGWEIDQLPAPMRGQFERGWDAAFIGECRTLVPKLIAELERMRTLFERYVYPY